MIIEGDYIICTADEAERYLIHRRPGDQLRTVGFTNVLNAWSPCEPFSERNPGEYHPVHSVQIRRLINQCTPEILRQAGYYPESNHFL